MNPSELILMYILSVFASTERENVTEARIRLSKLHYYGFNRHEARMPIMRFPTNLEEISLATKSALS